MQIIESFVGLTLFAWNEIEQRKKNIKDTSTSPPMAQMAMAIEAAEVSQAISPFPSHANPTLTFSILNEDSD